jgi:hypothetical protein
VVPEVAVCRSSRVSGVDDVGGVACSQSVYCGHEALNQSGKSVVTTSTSRPCLASRQSTDRSRAGFNQRVVNRTARQVGLPSWCVAGLNIVLESDLHVCMCLESSLVP